MRDSDAKAAEPCALQALVAKLYALPPKIIERAKQALAYKPPS